MEHKETKIYLLRLTFNAERPSHRFPYYIHTNSYIHFYLFIYNPISLLDGVECRPLFHHNVECRSLFFYQRTLYALCPLPSFISLLNKRGSQVLFIIFLIILLVRTINQYNHRSMNSNNHDTNNIENNLLINK